MTATRTLHQLLSNPQATLNGKATRTVAHNTALGEDAEGYSLYFHGHRIATWHRDGTITLNSYGYRTVTTKQRLNQALLAWAPSYRVSQRDFKWTVVGQAWERDAAPVSFPFTDGMRLEPGYGAVLDPRPAYD